MVRSKVEQIATQNSSGAVVRLKPGRDHLVDQIK